MLDAEISSEFCIDEHFFLQMCSCCCGCGVRGCCAGIRTGHWQPRAVLQNSCCCGCCAAALLLYSRVLGVLQCTCLPEQRHLRLQACWVCCCRAQHLDRTVPPAPQVLDSQDIRESSTSQLRNDLVPAVQQVVPKRWSAQRCWLGALGVGVHLLLLSYRRTEEWSYPRYQSRDHQYRRNLRPEPFGPMDPRGPVRSTAALRGN